MDDAIFDRYCMSNFYSFNYVESLLKDEKNLNSKYNKLTEQLKNKDFDDNNIANLQLNIINEMISDGILHKKQNTLIINQAMKATIEKFIDFIKNERNKKDE